MKNRKAFITGVAGFIGSNLAAALLKKGYAVVGVDNLSQGRKENMRELFGFKGFSFKKADVRSAKIMLKLSRGCSCIIHLAAFKIPRYGNAYDTLIVNTEGTRNMLDAAVRHKAKFVFASTSDVYGMSPDLPFEETGNLVLGESSVKRWAYAISKLFDEQLCFAYQDKFGLKISILRFFGSYGPNQNLSWRGGPQSVFIDAVLKNKPMEIHGDGRQIRSFTYIEDTVKGIMLAIEKISSEGQIFNIGNDKMISIIKLAELIWKLTRPQEKPKLKFVPYKSFSGKYQDVRKRVPSLLKSRKLLGFEPRVNLRDGLIRTIAWQKKVNNA